MATTVMNIRMDSELKKQFEAFCADMGLSVTAAVTVFAKKAVREYRIPFEIGAEIPNAETRKAIEDAKAGIGLSFRQPSAGTISASSAAAMTCACWKTLCSFSPMKSRSRKRTATTRSPATISAAASATSRRTGC